MTPRSKYHSLKSKNGNSRPNGPAPKKLRRGKGSLESDSTLSDFDEEVCGSDLNSSDAYAKWMQFIKGDPQGGARECSGQGESGGTCVAGKSEVPEGSHEKEQLEDPDGDITEMEGLPDYFSDFTNEGMLQIPETAHRAGAENGESSEEGRVSLPGFNSFKLERVKKSDRISSVERSISVAPKLRGARLSLENVQMDPKFRQNWRRHIESLESLSSSELLDLSTFFGLVNGYIDVEYSSLRAVTSPWAMSLCMLHISKHIYSSRQLVMSNNSRLQEAIRDKADSDIDYLGDDRFRDQGFNRCRVLVLCPFKGVAKQVVDTLVSVLPHGKTLRGYDRFEEEFGFPGGTSEGEDAGGRSKEGGAGAVEDGIGRSDELYRYLFDEKDNEDEFKLGIQLTKSGINIYSSFENSDIIIASPLGLRRAMGVNEGGKLSDASFCSSIEICLVFGADIILMQNWDHVLDIFRVMNKLPKKSLGSCDIRRVYQAFLDGKSKEFRQTILISTCRVEDVSSLIRNHTQNRRGFVRLWKPVERMADFSERNLPLYNAPRLVEGIQQMFIKTGDSGSPEESLLNYFSSTLYPDILAALDGKTQRVLVVLSNYVAYLRIRKYLLQQNAIFASCNESTSNASLSRNRQAFYKGELPILVTTERFLFFRRYLLKGATKVIFCGPPIYPNIYLDCINSMNFSQGPEKSNPKSSNPLAVTLFHWQNSLALERIVGTSSR
ncbi:hypothetical protein OJ252_2169 [Cryptosporidium canis]|uniref:U3 small nucleolar RNA-associated protein 25 n=1 Tax=Cryptosporidium canis TaxID=195482 RepID=A0ABQ8P616_9CRYT|nr:hypothetical protein OJ252_2169 [Cryptosporidium canis]